MSTQDKYLSLAAKDSTAGQMAVANYSRIAAGITLGSGFAWGSAVVELEWSIDPDAERWFSFTPAVTFSTSRSSYARIPVTGVQWVRFRTTTADGSSDPNAIYDVWGLA